MKPESPAQHVKHGGNCWHCQKPIGDEKHGVGERGPIHWACYDKLFPPAPAQHEAPQPETCPFCNAFDRRIRWTDKYTGQMCANRWHNGFPSDPIPEPLSTSSQTPPTPHSAWKKLDAECRAALEYGASFPSDQERLAWWMNKAIQLEEAAQTPPSETPNAYKIADDLVREMGRHIEGSAPWQVARERIRQELVEFGRAALCSSGMTPQGENYDRGNNENGKNSVVLGMAGPTKEGNQSGEITKTDDGYRHCSRCRSSWKGEVEKCLVCSQTSTLINQLLTRVRLWRGLYDEGYFKRHFTLYDGELEALIDLAMTSGMGTPPKGTSMGARHLAGSSDCPCSPCTECDNETP